MPQLNIDLDGLDSVITHPDNIPLLQESLQKINKEIGGYIHCPKTIKIIADKNLPQYEIAKDGDGYTVWRRTTTLEDSPFITWVEDLSNPPSWAIYFGLVEKMSPVFYLTKMGVTWNYNCKPMLPKAKTARRISYSEMKRLSN
jgi:hypothetical protein